MNKIFTSDFFKDDIFQLGFIIGFLAQGMTWFLLYWNLPPSSEPIALQYNIYFGINLIGPWYKAFFIPGVGAVIFFLNLFLAYGLYMKERIASYMLLIGSVVANLILLFSAHLITTFI